MFARSQSLVVGLTKSVERMQLDHEVQLKQAVELSLQEEQQRFFSRIADLERREAELQQRVEDFENRLLRTNRDKLTAQEKLASQHEEHAKAMSILHQADSWRLRLVALVDALHVQVDWSRFQLGFDCLERALQGVEEWIMLYVARLGEMKHVEVGTDPPEAVLGELVSLLLDDDRADHELDYLGSLAVTAVRSAVRPSDSAKHILYPSSARGIGLPRPGSVQQVSVQAVPAHAVRVLRQNVEEVAHVESRADRELLRHRLYFTLVSATHAEAAFLRAQADEFSEVASKLFDKEFARIARMPPRHVHFVSLDIPDAFVLQQWHPKMWDSAVQIFRTCLVGTLQAVPVHSFVADDLRILLAFSQAHDALLFVTELCRALVNSVWPQALKDRPETAEVRIVSAAARSSSQQAPAVVGDLGRGNSAGFGVGPAGVGSGDGKDARKILFAGLRVRMVIHYAPLEPGEFRLTRDLLAKVPESAAPFSSANAAELLGMSDAQRAAKPSSGIPLASSMPAEAPLAASSSVGAAGSTAGIAAPTEGFSLFASSVVSGTHASGVTGATGPAASGAGGGDADGAREWFDFEASLSCSPRHLKLMHAVHAAAHPGQVVCTAEWMRRRADEEAAEALAKQRASPVSTAVSRDVINPVMKKFVPIDSLGLDPPRFLFLGTYTLRS